MSCSSSRCTVAFGNPVLLASSVNPSPSAPRNASSSAKTPCTTLLPRVTPAPSRPCRSVAPRLSLFTFVRDDGLVTEDQHHSHRHGHHRHEHTHDEELTEAENAAGFD